MFCAVKTTGPVESESGFAGANCRTGVPKQITARRKLVSSPSGS